MDSAVEAEIRTVGVEGTDGRVVAHLLRDDPEPEVRPANPPSTTLVSMYTASNTQLPAASGCRGSACRVLSRFCQAIHRRNLLFSRFDWLMVHFHHHVKGAPKNYEEPEVKFDLRANCQK